MTVNKHRAPGGRQCYEILVLYQQTTAVGNVNYKWPKGSRVEQLSDFIRFHIENNTSTKAPAAIFLRALI